MNTKRLKPGIYYLDDNNLRMIEIAWVDEPNRIVTVWTYQCMKTGKGFLTDIPIMSFNARFNYLGEI